MLRQRCRSVDVIDRQGFRTPFSSFSMTYYLSFSLRQSYIGCPRSIRVFSGTSGRVWSVGMKPDGYFADALGLVWGRPLFAAPSWCDSSRDE
jgi:hypothetical protein